MKTKILVYACVALLSFTSCEDWLSQNDPKELSEDQAYSSVASISSIAANLYERIKLDQNFASDNESYDICRWDEATSNSYYWQFSSNVGRTYRNYYDYNLIRDINIHIRNLSEKTSHLPENQRAYFLGEARFLRAFTYFNMVKNLGGVPLITEVYDYSTTPIEYAKPRDTEAAVYEFVATEMDEVKEALDIAPQGSSLLTRATKASALALKSRAMLYAGTLAYNEDKSKTMGLTLTSGAVGISKNKATEYLQSCIDAYLELKEIGRYSLLKGTGSSIQKALDKLDDKNVLLCYPDEGAAKRYSSQAGREYVFCIKHRDWRTGKIERLELTSPEKVTDRNVLIVDDICSRGGTFTFTAKALKEAGANEVYLYVTHCENTIHSGTVLTDGLIRHVFTTDSIYRGHSEKISLI